MKIAITGMGYVGLATGILLAQHHEVTILDILAEKVSLLNHRQSPISDHEIELYLTKKNLNIKATSDPQQAYSKADFVIICTPTTYDQHKNNFDCSSVEEVIETVHSLNPEAIVVIKSIVPIGFTEKLREKYKTDKILFSPEFLREGKALFDNLYPTRIIIGDQSHYGLEFAALLVEGAIKRDIPILYTGSTEAEAIKSFSNRYEALRVSLYNEIDSYSQTKGLNTQQIKQGLGLDPRIESPTNKPSLME